MAFMIPSRQRALRSAAPLRQILLVAGFLVLPGCATLDHFGARSARFNTETVDSRSRAILINILRAAYGKPLQFSDLTTMTGESTAAAELGLSVPFAVNPGTTERTFSGSPKVSAGGTSTFNVANQNSKEFYNGLQTPISVQNIANFFAAGYDQQLVLFLAMSDITIYQPDQQFALHSTADSPVSYQAFYQAVEFLREAGLSTVSGEPSQLGPRLTASDLRNPKVISTMLSMTSGDLSLKSEMEGRKEFFHFYEKGSYKFCFDPFLIDKTRFQPARATMLNGQPDSRSMPAITQSPIDVALLVSDGQQIRSTKFAVPPAFFCDPPKSKSNGKGDKRDEKTTYFVFPTRSVEGIFQFLGGVVRQQLGLNGDPNGDPLLIGPTDRRGEIFPFRVVEGAPINAALTVRLDNRPYSIVTDASGKHDQSTRVLQLLTDLLALQSSAKDLPAPNVISVLRP